MRQTDGTPEPSFALYPFLPPLSPPLPLNPPDGRGAGRWKYAMLFSIVAVIPRCIYRISSCSLCLFLSRSVSPRKLLPYVSSSPTPPPTSPPPVVEIMRLIRSRRAVRRGAGGREGGGDKTSRTGTIDCWFHFRCSRKITDLSALVREIHPPCARDSVSFSAVSTLFPLTYYHPPTN